MPGWIGPWELAILLVVVLLVFGPKRLPEMGKSLGKGMREFKDSISGDHHDDDDKQLPIVPMTAADPLPTPEPVAVDTLAPDKLSPEERQRLRAQLDAADERDAVT